MLGSLPSGPGASRIQRLVLHGYARAAVRFVLRPGRARGLPGARNAASHGGRAGALRRACRAGAARRTARGRIWASQLIDFAEKYFWFGNYRDARRCYIEALRNDPSQVMNRRVLRHLAGSMIGRKPYEWLKGVMRRVGPAPHRA